MKQIFVCLCTAIALSLTAAGNSAITPNDKGIVGDDDSASIQNAVDRAAETGIGQVVIPARNERTGKAGWTLTRSILLPGNMTVVIDNASLALADDVYANFFRSANTWTEKGATPEGVLKNIRIIGRGTAVLHGGKANDLNEGTSRVGGRPHVRANCPVLFQNVVDFEVSNLTIENHRYWGVCFCFCRRGKISDLHFIARYDRNNQDGVNLRDGCRDITIANISGQTGDDMIALSAIDRRRTDGYNCWVDGLSPDICHVTIDNVSGAAVGHPLIALRNHNGSRIYDIAINNVVDTPFEIPCNGMEQKRYAIIRIGNRIYWHTRRSVIGEISRIAIKGVRCSYSEEGIVINNTLKDALFSDIRCTGPCASAVTTSGVVWGGIGATIEDVTIENATVSSDVPDSAVFDCSFINQDDHIRNVKLRDCLLVQGGMKIEYADVRVEKEYGESVAMVAASQGLEVKEGIVVLPDLEAGRKTTGYLESVPFRPGCNPVFVLGCHGRGGRVIVEVAKASDDDGKPGKWSPFKKVSDGSTVELMLGEWMKYRVTLSTSKRVSPHLHMIRFGKISHSKWILKADSR